MKGVPKVLDVLPPTNFAEAVKHMLVYIGEDPSREGLVDTPERVRRAWDEMFSGYKVDPKDILKVFTEDRADEMVVVRDIPFTSFCEHHLLPFTGVAHVAYVPDGYIVGLSKFGRLVDVFAKRLQVQERLTTQVVRAIRDNVPKVQGAGCVIEAEHSCMACRGVKKSGATTVTSSLWGCLRKKPEARAEFFACVRGS